MFGSLLHRVGIHRTNRMQGGHCSLADAPAITPKSGPAPRRISFPLVPDPRVGRLGPFLEQGYGIGRQISGPTTVPRVDTPQHGFVIAIDQVDKAFEVICVGVGEQGPQPGHHTG